MRLLLDECIDHRLRQYFTDHECQSAQYAGLDGLKNGVLLDAAEAAGFEVLVTMIKRSVINRTSACAGSRSSCFAVPRTGLSTWSG